MALRFLFLNTDYPEFLAWFYGQNPGLDERSWEEQLLARNASLFGVADFYSSNLSRLGHEAIVIHGNIKPLQVKWAASHGVQLPREPWLPGWRPGAPREVAFRKKSRRMFAILAAQIRHYQPDVLINQNMWAIPGSFIREMEGHARLLVGQIASPLPPDSDLVSYDLLISSLPNLVAHFVSLGVPAELHRLAFDPRVLDRMRQGASKTSFSFVGSISPNHQGRLRLLESLCERTDIRIWGTIPDSLPRSSPLHQRYQGPAWGSEMYQILHDSCITLNQHIDLADGYANNLRLYEATGVGTLLLTDWKENLGEMFEPEREVVTYRSPEECVERVKFYLEHGEDRERIARAGQRRTLQAHHYAVRMRELVELVEKHLR